MDGTTRSRLSKELMSLYEKKDYPAYIKKLQEHREGIPHELFLYNLAMAKIKEGDFAWARVHLERLKKEGLWDRRVDKNLAYVKEQLGPSVQETSLPFLDKAALGLSTSSVQHFVLCSLSLLFVMLLFWRRSFRKSRAFLALSFLIAVLPLALHFGFQVHPSGIVLRETPLREGPSASFEENGLLGAGIKVIIEKEDMGWLLIAYPSHLTGWMREEDLAFLGPRPFSGASQGRETK